MAAQLDFEPCPDCGAIRNSAGLLAHRMKKHGLVTAN